MNDPAPAPTEVGLDLDHATRRLLSDLRGSGLVPGDYQSSRYLHLLDEVLLDLNGEGPPMHAVHEVHEGDDQIRLFQPIQDPIGTVVFFGGGWTAGAIRHLDPVLRKLAERTSCLFATVDAGVIWSTPSAARVQRARSAFHAAVARASTIVCATAPVIVAGEGPGAWCSAVVAQGVVEPGAEVALQILLCPLLDADADIAAAGGPLTLSARAVEEFWLDRYSTPPPVHASVGHPMWSTLVVTAEYDVLRHQGARYAARLREAGLPVTHHDFPRQIHGFVNMLSLPHGEAAFQRIIRAVRSLAIPRMPSAAAAQTGGEHRGHL